MCSSPPPAAAAQRSRALRPPLGMRSPARALLRQTSMARGRRARRSQRKRFLGFPVDRGAARWGPIVMSRRRIWRPALGSVIVERSRAADVSRGFWVRRAPVSSKAAARGCAVRIERRPRLLPGSAELGWAARRRAAGARGARGGPGPEAGRGLGGASRPGSTSRMSADEGSAESRRR